MNDDPFFIVTSTGFRCPWAKQCIESVRAQRYPFFAHVYIAADEMTRDAASAAAGKDHRIIVQSSPCSIVENVYSFWKTLVNGAVIVWLDGDDWMESPDTLDKIADVYRRKGPWLTYGQFRFSSSPGVQTPFLGTRYPEGADLRSEPWRASHLKTFRAGLVKQVRKADLQRPDGTWTEYCTDRVFMLPMLEMAGERYEVVREVLSVYNWEASFSFRNQGNAAGNALEEAERARIHALPKYSRLETRPW